MIVGVRNGKSVEMDAVERIKKIIFYGRKVNDVLSEIDGRFYCDGLGIYYKEDDFNEILLGSLSFMDALTIPYDDMAIRIIHTFREEE